MSRHFRNLCRVLFVLVLVTACHASRDEPSRVVDDASEKSPDYTRVCDIRLAAARYTGRVVRLSAVYKSDQLYFSYLDDDSCATAGVINVEHRIRTKGDESVTTFFADEKARCESTNSVCIFHVEMDVDVEIKATAGGVVAEFKRFHSYKFVPLRRKARKN